MSDPQSPSGFAAPNYFAVPNVYADELLERVETLSELKVTLAIFRRTFGWHKREDTISLTQLQADTGLGRAAVVEGLKRATKHGVVTAVEPKRKGGATTYSVDVWFDERTTPRFAERTTSGAAGSSLSEPTKETSVGGEQQTLLDPDGSERKTASVENAGSPGQTPHSELHEGCARRGGVCDCEKRACGVDLRDAWAHWRTLAAPRNPEPTPSQSKMLERALRESSRELVIEAMDGLVEWQKQRGGDLSLSRIFRTRPGGDSLTDQIEWWAGQSGGPGGAHGFTSDALAKIARLKDHVRRDVDRGEALNRLSEEYGMVAIPPQGEREPWKFEVRRG